MYYYLLIASSFVLLSCIVFGFYEFIYKSKPDERNGNIKIYLGVLIQMFLFFSVSNYLLSQAYCSVLTWSVGHLVSLCSLVLGASYISKALTRLHWKINKKRTKRKLFCTENDCISRLHDYFKGKMP